MEFLLDERKKSIVPGTNCKATAERFDRIVEALGKGHSIESAAALAGVNRRTLKRWMQRAIERDTEDGAFSEFLSRCETARATFEASRIDIIREAGNKEWTAAAWWLERVEPERYGRRTVTHHAGPMIPKEFTMTIGGPVDSKQLEEGHRKQLGEIADSLKAASNG